MATFESKGQLDLQSPAYECPKAGLARLDLHRVRSDTALGGLRDELVVVDRGTPAGGLAARYSNSARD